MVHGFGNNGMRAMRVNVTTRLASSYRSLQLRDLDWRVGHLLGFCIGAKFGMSAWVPKEKKKNELFWVQMDVGMKMS